MLTAHPSSGASSRLNLDVCMPVHERTSTVNLQVIAKEFLLNACGQHFWICTRDWREIAKVLVYMYVSVNVHSSSHRLATTNASKCK